MEKNPDLKDPQAPEASLLPTRELLQFNDVRAIPSFIEKYATTHPKLTQRLARCLTEIITEHDVVRFFTNGEKTRRAQIVEACVKERLEHFKTEAAGSIVPYDEPLPEGATELFLEDDVRLLKLYRRTILFRDGFDWVMMCFVSTAWGVFTLPRIAANYEERVKRDGESRTIFSVVLGVFALLLATFSMYHAARVRTDRRNATEELKSALAMGDS